MQKTILFAIFSVGLLALSPLSYASAVDNNGLKFQVVQSQIVFDKSKIESVAAVKNADATYSLAIKLTADATDEMQAFTRAQIGKKINTVLNGKIISLSTVQSELGGSFMIMGFATKAEAEKAARSLRKSK